jgi:hypothetical protein
MVVAAAMAVDVLLQNSFSVEIDEANQRRGNGEESVAPFSLKLIVEHATLQIFKTGTATSCRPTVADCSERSSAQRHALCELAQ